MKIYSRRNFFEERHRKQIGSIPNAVLMMAAYDENGVVNVMNAA